MASKTRRNDRNQAPSSSSAWDSRVETWDEVAASPAFERFAANVRWLAGPRLEDHAVDLGAGTGLLALALAPAVEQVVAIDSSQAMLARIDEKAQSAGLKNIELRLGDLRSLPLEDECASLAVSNYAFHHLDDGDKELALSEVRRILVPGGRLVVCDMMFALSFARRDRTLIAEKVWLLARRGPAGWVRIMRNAARLAVGAWEHPSSLQGWQDMLDRRHFELVSARALEHEAGVVVARRPPRRTGELRLSPTVIHPAASP